MNATTEHADLTNSPYSDDDDAHPIHLHGNNFWVIKSNSSDAMNLINPPKRDVAAAGAAGSTFRFETTNPGKLKLPSSPSTKISLTPPFQVPGSSIATSSGT
jgi:hypothetical protein